MDKEEIAKRFCKFESCTHRNGEGTCCLYNQDNCIFHQLEKENAELKHNKKTVAHLAGCLEEKMKERIEELETRCTELFLQNNEFAERFEKSIEIIKKLLSCCRNYPRENAEKVKQAEQFLKE